MATNLRHRQLSCTRQNAAVQCHAIVLGYDRHNIHTPATPIHLKERKKKRQRNTKQVPHLEETQHARTKKQIKSYFTTSTSLRRNTKRTLGAKLKQTNRKLSVITLSPPGTDRIWGSTCHLHVLYVVPISGDPEAFFRFFTRESPFL